LDCFKTWRWKKVFESCEILGWKKGSERRRKTRSGIKGSQETNYRYAALRKVITRKGKGNQTREKRGNNAKMGKVEEK